MDRIKVFQARQLHTYWPRKTNNKKSKSESHIFKFDKKKSKILQVYK